MYGKMFTHLVCAPCEKQNIKQGGRKMKRKTLVCGVVLFAVVLVGVCSFAADKEEYGFYMPSPHEETFGVWINTEYTGKPFWPQKIVNYPWGAYDIYMLAINKTPDFRGSDIIVDKWIDDKGDIWYKMYSRKDWGSIGFFSLEKISKDGKVRESVWSYEDYPTEKDLNSKDTLTLYYRIYYR